MEAGCETRRAALLQAPTRGCASLCWIPESFVGSVGCPVTTYPGLLSMVASGALNPQGLVEANVHVDDVNGVLTSMSDFGTLGFTVISSWEPTVV